MMAKRPSNGWAHRCALVAEFINEATTLLLSQDGTSLATAHSPFAARLPLINEAETVRRTDFSIIKQTAALCFRTSENRMIKPKTSCFHGIRRFRYIIFVTDYKRVVVYYL